MNQPLIPRNVLRLVHPCWRLASLTVRHQSSSFFGRRPQRALLPPNVLYSDNHILVIHKPPGWHAVPNNDKEDDKTKSSKKKKCLLTFLQTNQWGGGSQKNFVKPVHRIDQPCSGILLLAKTSKAASRIAQVWKQKLVEKTYLCLIEAPNRGLLESRSTMLANDEEGWRSLEGFLHKQKRKPNSPDLVGWSVIVTAKDLAHDQETRHVSLEWRQIRDNLLLVRTKDGARHVIRALLGQVGQCPILGDVRYNSRIELPDQSVALHARSLELPERLQLGTTSQRYFEAPVPTSWKQFAKLEEDERMEDLAGH